jgi:hypothetical protein
MVRMGPDAKNAARCPPRSSGKIRAQRPKTRAVAHALNPAASERPSAVAIPASMSRPPISYAGGA